MDRRQAMDGSGRYILTLNCRFTSGRRGNGFSIAGLSVRTSRHFRHVRRHCKTLARIQAGRSGGDLAPVELFVWSANMRETDDARRMAMGQKIFVRDLHKLYDRVHALSDHSLTCRKRGA